MYNQRSFFFNVDWVTVFIYLALCTIGWFNIHSAVFDERHPSIIDGATNTDPTFNTQNLSPSPDAVMEFQVETSSYTADMGGAGGGQINIVTRSGTNDYHGTAYEFLRNGSMDAFSFGSMGMTKHLEQNNFGGAVGGPLFRKHTFFFVNYEGLRRAAADPMTETVPTAEEALKLAEEIAPSKIPDPIMVLSVND